MAIPKFQDDGFLPLGLHPATLDEIRARFAGNPGRQKLFERLRLFVELGRHSGAQRIFVDGSYVTVKDEPGDVDVVIWLDKGRYQGLLEDNDPHALDLELMFLTREPKEAFAVFDEKGWRDWQVFFSRVKYGDDARKGLVEVRV